MPARMVRNTSYNIGTTPHRLRGARWRRCLAGPTIVAVFDSWGSALIRWRWWVLAGWAGIGLFAAKHAGETVGRLQLRGHADQVTEALTADSLLATRFARPVAEFFVVTLSGPSSVTTGHGGALLDSLLATAAAQPYVRDVISIRSSHDTTFVSRDARSTFFLVSLSVGRDSAGDVVVPFRTAIHATAARVTGSAPFVAQVTGRAPLDLDVRSVSAEDAHRNERKLIPITLAVLVLAFGALVAALLPITVGFLAITIALAIVGVLARFTDMSVFVLNMISMIGLGVGIDYSLLIVTRFREELNAGHAPAEAAARTIATAGHAVLTSGLSVVVGFAALLLTPLSDARSVGIAGLVVVAVAVLLSVTLLPALLTVLGRSIDRPKWLARRLAWYHRPQIWERWARSLSRHPYRALAIGGSIIGLLTVPVLWLRIGLPSRNWWPTATEAGAGVATLEQMGMGGYVMPVRVLITFPAGTPATDAVALRALRHLSDTLRADPRVQDIRSLVDLHHDQSILELSVFYSDLDSVRAAYPDFLDAYLARDGRTTLLDVIPSDTTSLTTSMGLVRDIRSLARSGQIRQLKGATVRVGGYVAGALDFQELLLDRVPLIVGLILAVTAIMLAIVFRSVLVPIKAVVMNTLSVAGTFGVIVLVFQKGFGGRLLGLGGATSAIYVLVPVLVFAVVFGLSMDYEVFLLMRIKEAFDRHRAQQKDTAAFVSDPRSRDPGGYNLSATREGLSATASVITSAALIMIAVFGAFAFVRILMMQFIGFGLAVAVLLDATVIRMVLVPSLMQIAGRWNWWPGARD